MYAMSKVNSMVDTLKGQCAICWALGSKYQQHTLTQYQRGIGNGKNGKYQSLQLNIPCNEQVKCLDVGQIDA